MKKQETYRVTVGNTSVVYTEKELQNFIAAVVHNKGVRRFSVERIDAPESSESVHKKVEELLNDCGARAMRIVALTNELGPTVDAACIASNLKDVIKLLGYEQES